MSKYPNRKNLASWAGLILCLLVGFVFVFIGTGTEPVEREDMNYVTIRYEKYEVFGVDTEHIGIMDAEGAWYEVHHTSSDYALRQKLKDLPEGAELQLLLHPEEGYVLGIYREGTPLLGWQDAQQEIADEDLGFSWMGYGMWILGIVMFATEKFSKKKK